MDQEQKSVLVALAGALVLALAGVPVLALALSRMPGRSLCPEKAGPRSVMSPWLVLPLSVSVLP